MNSGDQTAILAIAMLAGSSDGGTSPAELAELARAATRLGSPDVSGLIQDVSGGRLTLKDLVSRLSDDEARNDSYETALAVIHADGAANPREQEFLARLREALGMQGGAASGMDETANSLANTAITTPESGGSQVAGGTPPAEDLDQLILKQAKLTAALEILPDRLANVAILPLQLRMVYQIGQRHGQRLDANQVKDLAATFGIGYSLQAVEGIFRKVFGGVVGGALGGVLGGASGIATAAAVTFASTYALGHAANQYYAQGRKLSKADLKRLFDRFREEANTLFPAVQDQIQTQSRSLNLQRLLTMVR